MASKDYIATETSTTWTGSGGDKAIGLSALAADGVAMGAFLDLGAAPRAADFTFELIIGGFATQTVEGEAIPIYFAQSEDGISFDGAPSVEPLATTAGTMTIGQLPNLLGPEDFVIQPDTATGSILKITSITRLTSRYIAPVIHNNTSDAFATTSTGHKLILTPKPHEGQ